MYINYLQDRQELGFTAIKDVHVGKQLSDLTDKVFVIIIVGVHVYFASPATFNNFEMVENQKPEVVKIISISGEDKYLGLGVSGGADDFTQKVIDQVLKKADPERLITEALKNSDKSIKAKLERILKKAIRYINQNPDIVKNSLVMLNEFNKPVPQNSGLKERLAPYDTLGLLDRQSILKSKDKVNIVRPKRPNEISKLSIKNDFEARVKQQQMLNAGEPEIPRYKAPRRRYPDDFKDLPKSGLVETKTRSAIKQGKRIGSKPSLFVEGLAGPQFNPSRFSARENTFGLFTPTRLEAGAQPTPQIFGADSITGQIQNSNTAFKEFQRRMNEIADLYKGEKRDNFLKQLDKCSRSRFENLSKEPRDNTQTISNVREAETLLQSEFESYHEPESITRTTYDEYVSGNGLDARFRKGLLSDETNTLNGIFTDVDVKVLISEETLKYQADLRKQLGHRNPDPLTMFEQGEQTGYSSILQKYKHCDAAMIERPSGPENVEHIVNFIELLQEETRIAKRGILEGAKRGFSEKLDVAKDSILDERALEEFLFLNEEYTIERRN